MNAVVVVVVMEEVFKEAKEENLQTVGAEDAAEDEAEAAVDSAEGEDTEITLVASFMLEI